MPDGYSTPPTVGSMGVPTRSPGDDWASMIQSSRPTTMPAAATDPLLAPVFLGMGVRGGTDATGRGFGSETSGADAPATSSIDSLLRSFEEMDRKEQRRLALLLTIGGFAGSVSLEDAGVAARDLTLNETLNAYLDLLNDAAGRYARGQNISPEQLLEQNVAYRLPRGSEWDGSYSGLTEILAQNDINISDVDEEEKDLSGTFTSTSSSSNVSRDVMDPNDAMALTRAMLQRELGRDPTKAEFEDFIGAVQNAQRTNPTRTNSSTTTTYTKDKKGRVVDTDNSSTSSTQSGISQAGIEDVLLRRARQNPDWAEWQAVGTYAPALFQALGATVPGV